MSKIDRSTEQLSSEIIETWSLVREEPFLQTAINASLQAGEMLHAAFQTQFKVSLHEDQSEYTPFDSQAEQIARDFIKKIDPDTTIMGEELSPNEDISGKTFWVIDGIDGTTNFAHGIPLWNFTMAYVVDGKTQVGVVYDAVNNNLYYAVAGKGAYCNGERLCIGDRSFREALISFAPLLNVRRGKGRHEKEEVEATWAGMRRIVARSGRFPRELQSGGLELSMVAEGKLDGYASSWTNPWDLSAGVLLVQEAGGRATNILGKDWQPSYWGVIAGSPQVHKAMLAILQLEFFLLIAQSAGIKQPLIKAD